MTKYKIRVDDIYHQGYEDDSYYINQEFSSYNQAEEFCKIFLDKDFNNIVKDCKNKDDFYNYWAYHGEALYISPDNRKNSFNSRDYIESKVEKYFNN